MIAAQEIVELALQAADASKTKIAVIVSENHGVNLRWAVNTLTTNGLVLEQEVNVVAFHEQTTGVSTATATGNVHSPEDVRSLVAQAQASARKASPAEDAAPLIDGGSSQGWDRPPAGTDASELQKVSVGLGEAFGRASFDDVEHFGFADHSVTTTYLGVSSGTRLRHSQVAGRLEMTAKSHGRSRSAWVGSAEPNMQHLDIGTMDADLRRSLAWQGKSIPVEPGRHRVLLSSSAVSDLMVDMYWAADARSAVEGQSVFSKAGGGTRVGETLTASPITLSSDPLDTRSGMACGDFEVATMPQASSTPFDNGVPLSATKWIEDGTLRHLISTRRTANLAKIPNTPGIDNLTLTHPDGYGTPEDLARRMGDGLLVTCLWYNRVLDPQTLLLTGLTRDGVYVVRDGEIVGACGNFRFNDSPVSVLGRIVDSGSTVRTLAREMGDYFNRAAMPPLVIDEFNLSTPSEAR